MSELEKSRLKIVERSLSRFANTWEKFPEFARPDIQKFLLRLELGFPADFPEPRLFHHLNDAGRKIMKDYFVNESDKRSSHIVDPFSGILYLSDYTIYGNPRQLENDVLGLLSSATSTRRKISQGIFDTEEKNAAYELMGNTCSKIPREETLSIVYEGFRRILYFRGVNNSKSVIGFLPVKGTPDDGETPIKLKEMYFRLLRFFTRMAINRGNNMEQLYTDIGRGKLRIEDVGSDRIEFINQVFYISRQMDNTPWPLFEASLMNGFPEAEAVLYEFDTTRVMKGNYYSWQNSILRSIVETY